MKIIRRGLTVLTATALALGTLAAVPAAASLNTGHDSAATASNSGATVTLKVKNSVTGLAGELWQPAISVEVDVPDPYVYTTRYGFVHTEDVNWVASYSATGDPSCSRISSTTRRGTGDYTFSDKATIFPDTLPGKCTVSVTVIMSRTLDGFPEASYTNTIKLTAPWLIKAKAVVSTPKVSHKSVTRGSKIKVTGNLSGQVGYSAAKVIPSRNSKVSVQARTPGKPWRTVATVRTNNNGNWYAWVKPATSNTIYRAVWTGGKSDVLLSGSSKSSARVSVSAKAPTSTTIKTSKRSGYTTLSGRSTIRKTTSYVSNGKAYVQIQRKAGKKWQVVKTVRANAKGNWSYRAKTKKGTYRVVVKAAKSSTSYASKSISVR